MTRYKIMFKEHGEKRFYNFGPTIHSSAKSRYSKIDSRSKAESVKRELQRVRSWKGRTWKIVKKR